MNIIDARNEFYSKVESVSREYTVPFNTRFIRYMQRIATDNKRNYVEILKKFDIYRTGFHISKLNVIIQKQIDKIIELREKNEVLQTTEMMYRILEMKKHYNDMESRSTKGYITSYLHHFSMCQTSIRSANAIIDLNVKNVNFKYLLLILLMIIICIAAIAVTALAYFLFVTWILIGIVSAVIAYYRHRGMPLITRLYSTLMGFTMGPWYLVWVIFNILVGIYIDNERI